MCYSIVKTVFLFVGAVIGAGFATGSEIMLYFGDSGIWSVILSGMTMGLLAAVYGLAGKLGVRYRYLATAQKVLVFIATIVPYVIILGGTEEIVFSTFGIENAGVVTGIIVALLMLYDMRIIKLLNLIIVPCIIVLMAVLVAKTGEVGMGTLDAGQSVMYAFMNMMLGGYIMSVEGKKYSVGQIVTVGGIIALVMTVIMIFCYMVSVEGLGFSMPLYEVARRMGFGIGAGIIIYLAIFTTLIGSARVCADMLADIGISKYLTVFLLAVISFFAARIDFARAVYQCYPTVGYMGLAYGITVIAGIFVAFYDKSGQIRRIILKRRNKVR